MKLLLLVLFLIVLISVPLFEQLAINKIRRGKKTPYLLNQNIKIHYEINTGMMMGLARKNRVLVLIVTTVLLFFILSSTLYLILFTKDLIILKLGLIILSGGSISNGLERYIYKGVIDYISFPKAPIKKTRNIIFNVADFFIFIGCILMILGIFFIWTRQVIYILL